MGGVCLLIDVSPNDPGRSAIPTLGDVGPGFLDTLLFDYSLVEKGAIAGRAL